MIAAARILMPAARVRLVGGRRSLTREAQLLCFLAGANSIFYGDKLLTTANNDAADDLALIEEAGLQVEPTPLMRPSGPELPAPPCGGARTRPVEDRSEGGYRKAI